MDKNKPFSDYGDFTLAEFKKMVEKTFEKPKEHSGTTVCGMIWKSSEPQAIVTCKREICKTCREFDELLMREYYEDNKK